MRLGWRVIPADVTPADDITRHHGDQSKIALDPSPEDEVARLLQRRRFQEREVKPLSRDDVERAMETWDQVVGQRPDDDGGKQ